MKVKTKKDIHNFLLGRGFRPELGLLPRQRGLLFKDRTAIRYYDGSLLVATVINHPRCRHSSHTIFYSEYGAQLAKTVNKTCESEVYPL